MARQSPPMYPDPVEASAVILSNVDRMIVSVDVSTGDHDYDARVYGQIYGTQAEGDNTVTLLAEVVQDTRRPDPLRDMAEWLVSLDDPEDVDGREQRRTVTLDQIIARAREALGRNED